MKTINGMKFTLSIAIAILLLATALPIVNSDEANASILANFNPGNIMSDAVMTNHNSMNEAQIQQFLLSRCDQPNCMSQRNFNGESAARIIHQAAQEWRINPQVLIVKLQKEQGLITNPNPQQWRLDSATGFGCPDSTPNVCMAHYLGFRNQIRNAARFFRAHLDQNPHWWKPHRPGWNNIFWHPSGIPLGSRCGTSRVYIENRATSALYSYTPYRPNQAALDAGGWRPGDSCSSYGNRNFFYDFTRWFGSTQTTNFTRMAVPRLMQVREDTQKVRVFSGERFGPVLTAGRQIKFVDRITIDGRLYLRTEWDSRNRNPDAILIDDLEEIPILDIPNEWRVTTVDARRFDPIRRIEYNTLRAGSLFKSVEAVNVGGTVFHRTEGERNIGRFGMISNEDSMPFTRFLDFTVPRNMTTMRRTEKIDILTGEVAGYIEAGTANFYDRRVIVNGVLFVQHRDKHGAFHGINFNDLHEGIVFNQMAVPRWMQVRSDTTKFNTDNMQPFGPILQSGRQIHFVDRISINGRLYLRTRFDTTNNNRSAIPIEDLEEINPEFTRMAVPRYFYIPSASVNKIHPITESVDVNIPRGQRIFFTDRITIGGQILLRTRDDSNSNILRAVPINQLREI